MSGRPVELVVTDLDGTLWDRSERLHPSTAAALAHLDTVGLPVLAATARRPAGAFAAMRANKIALPAVLFDGALGKDAVDGATFHRAAFDPPAARSVLAAFLDAGVEPCLNIDHPSHDFVVGPHSSTHPDHLAFNAGRTLHAALDDVLPTVAVLSFTVVGRDRSELASILASTSGLGDGSVIADTFYGGHSLSIRPRGTNKWSGTLAFCASRSLDPSRVLAVGNGENDRELLREAAVACAPADSCREALALADRTVPPAGEGGWAAILDLVG